MDKHSEHAFVANRYPMALKKAFDLIRRKDYGKRWYLAIYDLTDFWGLKLSPHLITYGDDNLGGEAIEMSYLDDSGEEVCIVESPRFGGVGSKAFVRFVARAVLLECPFWDKFCSGEKLSKGEARDIAAAFKFMGESMGCINDWMKHARYCIYIWDNEKTEDGDMYFDENGNVDLDVFCKEYGLVSGDIEGVENHCGEAKVYIKYAAFRKLVSARECALSEEYDEEKDDDPDFFDGYDEYVSSLLDGIDKDEEKASQGVRKVRDFLNDHGYLGTVIWGDTEMHGVFADKLVKNDKALVATVDMLSGLVESLIRKSNDPKMGVAVMTERLYNMFRDICPEEAAKSVSDAALVKFMDKNAKA